MGVLEIDLTRAGTIALRGRLDACTASAARAALQDFLDGADDRPVVDLRDLEIWDRSGLGVIVGLARVARRRGQALVLANAGGREQRLLRVAGVTRAARLLETVA